MIFRSNIKYMFGIWFCILAGSIILTSILNKTEKQVEKPIFSDRASIAFGSEPKDFKFKLTTPAKIISIHDGDTITVELRLETNIRMLDCWAPEIVGVEKTQGLKSRDFLESLIKVDDNVIIEVPFQENISKSISLSRILAKVYKDVDNDGNPDDISDLMVKNGFAKSKKE